MDTSAYLFDPGVHAGSAVLRGATLPDVIAATVAAHGDREAIVDGTTRLTYRELDRRATALAAALERRGVGRGSVVGVHLGNSWECLCAVIGVARLGAVSLPLHPPYRRHELQTLLAATSAVAAICSPTALATIEALDLPELATIVATGEAFDRVIADGAGIVLPASRVQPQDPISLNPTSGTESSRPNICMHAHDGLLSNSFALAQRAGYSATDRVLISGGFTHLFGMAAVQMCAIAGAAIYVQAFDAAAWLDLCERERITRAWVVPPHLGALLAEQTARPRDLALRELRTGGTAIDAQLAARVQATLCANFVIQWGTSEIGGGATTLPGASFAEPSLGTPLAGTELRFVDGELWCRRADMFRGYYGDPEQTAAVVSADGFVRTGDLVRPAPDGSLAFDGRTKDIINRGGVKISAFELEALLVTNAAFRQLAVVAYPDERLSERTALVCSFQPGAALDLAGITGHLERLGVAKFKWPERLVVLDELPTTATGKVAKAAVRALIAQRGV